MTQAAAARIAQHLQRRAIFGATPAAPRLWALSARVVLARSVC